MKYSKTSSSLLINMLVISSATFMINPLLIIGGATSFMTSSNILSMLLMIALISGNIIAIFIIYRLTIFKYYSCLFISMIGLCIAAILMALSIKLSHNYGIWIFGLALIIFRAFIATSMMVGRMMHTITNLHHPNCSLLFARISSIFGIGSAIGPIGGTFIYEHLGFMYVLIFSGALFFCGTILIILENKNIKYDLNEADLNNTENISAATFKTLFNQSRNSTLIILASVIFFILLGQSFGFIPVLLQDTKHTSWIGLFFLMNAGFLMFLSEPVIYLLNKLKVSNINKMSFSIVLIVIALSLFSSGLTSITVLTIAVFLYSLAEILFQVYAMETIRKYEIKSNITNTIKIYTFITTSVGLGVGQYIGLVGYTNLALGNLWYMWLILGIMALFSICNLSWK